MLRLKSLLVPPRLSSISSKKRNSFSSSSTDCLDDSSSRRTSRHPFDLHSCRAKGYDVNIKEEDHVQSDSTSNTEATTIVIEAVSHESMVIARRQTQVGETEQHDPPAVASPCWIPPPTLQGRSDVFLSRRASSSCSSFDDDTQHVQKEQQNDTIQPLRLTREQRWVQDSFHSPHPAPPRVNSSNSSDPSHLCDFSDNNNSQHNHVSFGTIRIREFLRTVGDSPSTTSGVPVTLEWQHHSEYQLSIDQFEQVRPERRRLPIALQMSAMSRLHCLKKAGWGTNELKQYHVKEQPWQARAKQEQQQHKENWKYRLEEVSENVRRGILNATIRRIQKKKEREWIEQQCQRVSGSTRTALSSSSTSSS